jgi:DNA-binding transcriptional LysR family regulator
VPALPEFLARYPEIEVDLTITDRVVDLVEEGADVGLRTGHLADSSLVSRKICDLERVICAAPAYLERRGRPRKPGDLLAHNCLVISGTPQFQRWPFRFPDGVRDVAVSGNVSANNAETLVQLAVNGLGIIRLVDVVVGEAIARGELEPVLAQSHHVEPLPLHAVFPHGRHRSPRVAALVDFLVEKFSGAPWRVREAVR